MTSSESDRNPVEKLAEEFAERFRRGERPSLSEFVDQYPEWAEDIRDLFPALVKMEQLKPAPADGTGSYGNDAAGNPAPDRVGDYRILREVGRGGMGVVYEAEQMSLGRHVALKVLPTFGLINPVFLERFRREAKAAARLHHTNIVPVFGVGESDGLYYYAMQFIQGEGLDKVLHDLRRFRDGQGTVDVATTMTIGNMTGSVAEGLWTGRFIRNDELLPTPKPDDPASGHDAVSSSRSELTNRSTGEYFRSVGRVGMQVAEALSYAHKQGILHRDIKPSNLLLDQQGAVWVTDFGLAKAEGSDELTHTGDIVGTLRFMAPERFDGASLPQSDVYGLGLTLYEMLSLRPAFEDANRARLIERILHDPPASPRKHDPRIPRDLETIVLKAIAKDPADRYAAAETMAEDLERFLADRPIRARRASTTERLWRWCRRNPAVATLTTAVLLLLVVMAFGSTWAAIRLRSELSRSESAERDGKHKLIESYISEADATRMSGQAGQRFGALSRIRDALAISQEIGLNDGERLRLRNVAIAALCRPDAAVDLEWPAGSDAALPEGLDPALRRLAIAENSIARLPPPAYRLRGRGWYSLDGRFVAVGLQPYIDGKRTTVPVRVWRIDGAAPKLVLDMPEGVNEHLTAFRPDGRQVAFGHADGTADIHDTATGRRLRRLVLGPSAAGDLAYHPWLPRLATSHGSDVVIWDTETEQRLLTVHSPAPLFDLAWHPDGRRLATNDFDRGIDLWDTETGRMLTEPWLVDRHGCIEINYSHAGDIVASRDWNCILRLWDPATGRHLFSFQACMDLYFAADDRSVGLLRKGDLFQTLRIAGGQELRILHRPTPQGSQRFDTVALHPNGRLLAVTTQAGLGFFDLTTGEEVQFIPGGFSEVRGFDGTGALWTAGPSGLLRWRVQASAAAAHHLRIGPPEWVADVPPSLWTCSFSADGRVAAVPLGGDGALVVHRGGSRRTLRLGPQYDVRSVVLSRDGRWVVSVSHWDDSSGIRYKLWDAETGKLLANLPFPRVKESFGFTADSRWLYVGDPEERWVDVPALAAAPAPKSPESPTSESIKPGGVLSQDHRLRALATDQGIVRLVSPETDQEIARLPSPEIGTVTPDTFSPDGSRLLARGKETGELYIFDLHRIREQLAELGLDWPDLQPPLPARPKEDSPALAPRLEVELIDAESASSRERMNRCEVQRVSVELAMNPFDARAHYRLGGLQLEGGRYAEAYVHLSAALAFHPDLQEVYGPRAKAAFQLCRWADAAADAGRYLEKWPYDIFARRIRAAANVRRQHYAEAIVDLTALLETDPQSARLYQQRGACYEALGKTDLAADDRSKAIKLGPEDPEILNDEAWQLVVGPKEKRDPPKAIALIQRAIELRPNEPKYLNTLGVAQYRKGDFLPAIEALEKSLALGQGKTDAFDLYVLAMCHKKLGQPAQANDRFEHAVLWTQQHQNQLAVQLIEQLAPFRAEAESVLKEP